MRDELTGGAEEAFFLVLIFLLLGLVPNHIVLHMTLT